MPNKLLWSVGCITGAFLLVLSCTKTTINSDPLFDLEPAIKLESFSSASIVQFTDSLAVEISYEDGDGDLGSEDPDFNSIFVQDARLSKADEYYVPPLAPVDATLSIQGKLLINLAPTFLLGNGTQETTTFSLYMIDRAGHQSNTIEIGPITILQE